MSTASQAAQDNLQGASQVTQQGVQAIQQAAEAAEVANQPVQQVALAGGWESGRIVQAGDQTPTQKGREPTVLEYAGADRTAAIQLIDELLAGDASYDKKTWPEIAEALDRDRLSNRKLFR